jgi:hypothetical protein
MALHANGRSAPGKAVLALAKSALADVAVTHRQAHPQKHFLANAAGHPMVVRDFSLVVVLLVKTPKVNFGHQCPLCACARLTRGRRHWNGLLANLARRYGGDHALTFARQSSFGEQ